MPVVVPYKYEKKWTEQVKDTHELKSLYPIMMGWSAEGWLVEDVRQKEIGQMSLF